jgi:hypothetical protein
MHEKLFVYNREALWLKLEVLSQFASLFGQNCHFNWGSAASTTYAAAASGGKLIAAPLLNWHVKNQLVEFIARTTCQRHVVTE